VPMGTNQTEERPSLGRSVNRKVYQGTTITIPHPGCRPELKGSEKGGRKAPKNEKRGCNRLDEWDCGHGGGQLGGKWGTEIVRTRLVRRSFVKKIGEEGRIGRRARVGE